MNGLKTRNHPAYAVEFYTCGYGFDMLADDGFLWLGAGVYGFLRTNEIAAIINLTN